MRESNVCRGHTRWVEQVMAYIAWRRFAKIVEHFQKAETSE
jgi:hypothetical protein